MSLEDLALDEDVLTLQFLLRTEGEPSGIELLVLRIDGLGLSVALVLQVLLLCLQVLLVGLEVLLVGLESSHIAIQARDGLVELLDMDVLLLEFGTQRAKLLVLLNEPSVEGLDGLLHLLTLEARRAELLLQLLDQIAVLLHTLGDKLDVLLDHGRLVTTFAILRHRHTVSASLISAKPC